MKLDMRIKSLKCNPPFSISEGEAHIILNDTEIGTISRALNDYIKYHKGAAGTQHIENTVKEWAVLDNLVSQGNLLIEVEH